MEYPTLKSEKNRRIFTRWESRENRTSGGNSKHLYPIFKAELHRVICCAIDTCKALYPIIHATFGEKAIWVVILQSQT